MNVEEIDAAVERVKASTRVGLPARLSDEIVLLETATTLRYITWSDIAKRLGVKPQRVFEARKAAHKLHEKALALNESIAGQLSASANESGAKPKPEVPVSDKAQRVKTAIELNLERLAKESSEKYKL